MIEHSQTVNGLCWFVDGSGFVTGGMDRKIIQWVSVTFKELFCVTSSPFQDKSGDMKLIWPQLDIRILELAITPDGQRLVAIGVLAHPVSAPTDATPSTLAQATLLQASAGLMPPVASGNTNGNSAEMERRIVVYDLATKQEIWYGLKLNIGPERAFTILSQVSSCVGRATERQDLG